MLDPSERQPSEVISEKDGEISPWSKTKLKRVNSPRKMNKLKLPNLNLIADKKSRATASKFREWSSNIHGVVPVVKQIRYNSKHLFRRIGNTTCNKFRTENPSPENFDRFIAKSSQDINQDIEFNA